MASGWYRFLMLEEERADIVERSRFFRKLAYRVSSANGVATAYCLS